MAWQELVPPSAELSLKTSGVVEWNTALQVLLGNPKWVGLVWDSSSRWLGIHRRDQDAGFPVYCEPESGEFRIDSADALNAVGVSVASNHAASPTEWTNDGSYRPHGRPSVFFVTIP